MSAPDPKAGWWAEDGAVAALDFGVALTVNEFDAAFRLLHDQYVSRGYMKASPSQRRLSVHHLLPSTKVLVAKRADQVVASLTVVEDSRLGLPIDEAIGIDLDRLRHRGRRIGELGALAVDAAYRRSGVALLVRLYRVAVLYAARIARLDDLAFVVHPRHREFYRALFPFRELSGTRTYRRLDGTPVIGLRFELSLIRALIRVQRAGFPVTPFMKFMFGPEACDQVLARLRLELSRSALLPFEWARLFSETEGRASDTSAIHIAAVGAVHSEPGGDR